MGGGGGEAATDRQQLASSTQIPTTSAEIKDVDDPNAFSTAASLSSTADAAADVALASIVSAEGWSPVLYRLLIEPDFGAAVSNGSVDISVLEDKPLAAAGALPLPIVLDINNITVLSASGKCTAFCNPKIYF